MFAVVAGRLRALLFEGEKTNCWCLLYLLTFLMLCWMAVLKWYTQFYENSISHVRLTAQLQFISQTFCHKLLVFLCIFNHNTCSLLRLLRLLSCHYLLCNFSSKVCGFFALFCFCLFVFKRKENVGVDRFLWYLCYGYLQMQRNNLIPVLNSYSVSLTFMCQET